VGSEGDLLARALNWFLHHSRGPVLASGAFLFVFRSFVNGYLDIVMTSVSGSDPGRRTVALRRTAGGGRPMWSLPPAALRPTNSSYIGNLPAGD
jgi:hypothetical protein